MRLLGFDISRGRASEARASVEDPAYSIADLTAWQTMLGAWASTAGPVVTVETALGVPAFWAGVNFLSNLMAGLPFHEFKRSADGNRQRVTSGMIAGMLAGTVNDDLLTSFKWRKGRHGLGADHGRRADVGSRRTPPASRSTSGRWKPGRPRSSGRTAARSTATPRRRLEGRHLRGPR
jgi:hypothetical protein